MKFKNVLKSRAVIKKSKFYEFPEINLKDIENAKGRDYKHPLLIKEEGAYYALYYNAKKLCIVLLHSYDVFEEIVPIEWECSSCGQTEKQDIAPTKCSCGSRKTWYEVKK